MRQLSFPFPIRALDTEKAIPSIASISFPKFSRQIHSFSGVIQK